MPALSANNNLSVPINITMPPRRQRRARKPRRKMNRRKGHTNVADKAGCSVKIDLQPSGQPHFSSNTIYSLTAIQLSQYDRAATIAKAYQHYRIKSVKLTTRIAYDTYQYDGTNNISRPDLYYQIDKAGVLNPATATIGQLKQMGARPRACDEKPTVITWSPSVLSEMESGPGATASSYKVSPWLSTSSSQVLHRGLFWYVAQLFGTGLNYTAELELQFEFKKPVWTALSVDSPPAVEAIPKLDNVQNYPATDAAALPKVV